MRRPHISVAAFNNRCKNYFYIKYKNVYHIVKTKCSIHGVYIIASLFIWIMVHMPASVLSIGVSYGRLGDNLPEPSEVVNLYKSQGISRMRIYDPNPDVLQALRDSGIQLLLDVPKTDLPSLAGDPSVADTWVQNNIVAYWPSVSFRYIAVGNEVDRDAETYGQYLVPAMDNIQNALASAGLAGAILVSTAVSSNVMGVSYPPSAGAFSDQALAYMGPVVQFLATHGAPLLVNIYPYFSYASNKGQISIDYALFTSPGTVVTDPNNGLDYQNLFDAMVDAVVAALEKAGGPSVAVVVSESGWPSAGGGDAATVGNAQVYNQNLIGHVGQGTPRRSGTLETYIFAMFNENRKEQGVEQNWGLFYPNEEPVYGLSFYF